jgi:hypothetical protein
MIKFEFLRLIQKHAKFIQKEIHNFVAFLEDSKFDIVFNCVGLAADKLCNDDKLKPIRGQMIRVKLRPNQIIKTIIITLSIFRLKHHGLNISIIQVMIVI